VRITSGDWSMTAAPDRGGAVLSLTHGGRDILRPTAPGADDPLAMACFPLVPYANRIGFGRFDWCGSPYHLNRNYPGQAHPLHGTGWLTRWNVIAHGDTAITMRLSHVGDDAWPWDFTAEQQLQLSPAGLMITLSVRNIGDRSMPVSLGLHPYFAPAETLRFSATGVWLVDDGLLPVSHAPADTLGDWSTDGALIRRDLVDHCYTGWQGRATIARADGDIVITAEGAPCLHVYIPPGEDFFCVEPVTAMPDAVNHDAARALAPGEATQITLTIGTAPHS